MTKKITIFGSGYVGLVQGAVLSEAGHSVVCVDTDQRKIGLLNRGIIPIYEPGLSRLISDNFDARRIRFTTDEKDGIGHGDIIFIAVGTPPGEDGTADLRYVEAVAKSVARYMEGYKIIVNKSTVPVGTAEKVAAAVQKELNARKKVVGFDVVSNPEFLKEGAAITDCTYPDRIVIGTNSAYAAEQMRELYAPFLDGETHFLQMDIRSAELTKYAANCMLATKISFMNEIANLAEVLGADIEMVRQGIGSDPRIGFQFINPGCGYGGSCFPKDVKALIRTAEENGYKPQILSAVESVNVKQKEKLFSLISSHYQGQLAGLTFALWGLAFKPDTDDMREAPSRILIEKLWEHGARVRAFDPEAMGETKNIYGENQLLELTETKEEALRGADALVICTDWREFRDAPLREIGQKLEYQVIFDGRNIYDIKETEENGFTYYGIGRGESVKKSGQTARPKNGEESAANGQVLLGTAPRHKTV